MTIHMNTPPTSQQYIYYVSEGTTYQILIFVSFCFLRLFSTGETSAQMKKSWQITELSTAFLRIYLLGNSNCTEWLLESTQNKSVEQILYQYLWRLLFR